MLKSIVWTSLVKLDCIDTLGSEVYICVTPTKIAPSSNPFAIEGALSKWTKVVGDLYYRYTLEYDDIQLTSSIDTNDISGVICKDCLTKWASGNAPVITEEDPVFKAWLLATPPIYTETDPIFQGSPAHSITVADINNWNASSGSCSVTKESPIGAVNGANTIFFLSHAPIVSSLILLLNGVNQTEVFDYTLASTTIIMQSAPVVGDILTAYYLEA